MNNTENTLTGTAKVLYKEGYQAAEKELPTWDDVRKAILLAQTVKDYGDYKSYTEEEIIECIKREKTLHGGR